MIAPSYTQVFMNQQCPFYRLFILYVIGEPKWVFKNTIIYICLFESLENLYCPDGWRGGGDQKRPSIFLIFKYNINKKNMLIPNIVSKIVYGFSKRSYKHFKFQNMTSQLKKRRNFNGIYRFFGILKAN